jgi:hypothetical protein
LELGVRGRLRLGSERKVCEMQVNADKVVTVRNAEQIGVTVHAWRNLAAREDRAKVLNMMVTGKLTARLPTLEGTV